MAFAYALDVSQRMKSKQSSLSDDLVETTAEIGNFELPAEILEFSIDQLLDSGILKDIPFVGWIAKGISLGLSISDRILYNKIIRFIYALEELGSTPIEDFRKSLKTDLNYKRKVGEHLLLTLDRLNDLSKPEFVARCFDHFLTGDIDFDKFVEIAHAVEQATIIDLRVLCGKDGYRLNFSSFGRAAGAGILDYGLSGKNLDYPEDVGVTLSKLGKDLRDILQNDFRGREEREAKERAEMVFKNFGIRE